MRFQHFQHNTPNARKAVEMAHWFIEKYQGRVWDDMQHEKQLHVARSLLDSGATVEQIKGCVQALAKGTLPSQKGKVIRVSSLLFLSQQNPYNAEGLTALEEWQQIDAYNRYINRPEMRAFRAEAEAFFFGPKKESNNYVGA